MKKALWIGFVWVVVGLMLVLPTFAQDDAQPEVEVFPISGTIIYSPPELLSLLVIDGETYADVTDVGEWAGDIVGTESNNYRAMFEASGAGTAPVLAEIEGTVLGEYEGSMVVWSQWKRVSETSEWHAEWWILSGTGDLANVFGRGFIWGPGESGLDYEYSGTVFFAPPAEE